MANPRKEIVEDGKATRFSKENQPEKHHTGPRLTTIIKKLLEDGITIDGKKADEYSVCIKLIQKANDGDMAAIKEVLDRIDGKTQQTIDMTSKGESIKAPIINVIGTATDKPL